MSEPSTTSPRTSGLPLPASPVGETGRRAAPGDRDALAARLLARHGQGDGAARAAVLGYRVVNYWLPLLPGALAYLYLRLRPERASQTNPRVPPAD